MNKEADLSREKKKWRAKKRKKRMTKSARKSSKREKGGRKDVKGVGQLVAGTSE